MPTLVLLLALAANKPNFDQQYFTKCYDGESADTCQRRQERWNSEMERYRQELAEEAARELEYVKKDAVEVTVAPGPDRAVVGELAVSWCKGLPEAGPGDVSGLRAVRRNIESFTTGRYFSFGSAVSAAQSMCLAPDNPDVKLLAKALVQAVVNVVGYGAEDAVADLTARLDEAAMKKSKAALCQALKPSGEADGDVKALADAKWMLFGCDQASALDGALWTNTSGVNADATVYYLDTAVTPESEVLRLAWLLSATRDADKLPEQPHRAILAAMVLLDVDGFDAKRAEAELAQPPFAGNAWAQVVTRESVGAATVRAKAYRAAVDGLTAKDDGWKELLVTAPKKAVADWTARAAKFDDALAHSREFEKQAFGPSRKALKGCAPALRADFSAYLKTVKAATAQEFSQAVVGDPVGSLLLHRLAACESAEGNKATAGLLKASWEEGRVLRGPRFAALYAAIEVLGELKKDRPKFPLEPGSVRAPVNRDLLERFDDGIASVAVKHYGPEMTGSVVKTVKKQGDTVRVVFTTTKSTIPAHDCVDTNRIMRIEPNGTILYYRNCTFGKRMVTYTEHLEDAVMPAALATGIKAGAWVEVTRAGDYGLPLVVYADKSQKKLVAWRGFGL